VKGKDMAKNDYDYAEPAYDSDNGNKPSGPLMGFLTTKLLVTEREPLFAGPKGMTPGQIIDARIKEIGEEQFTDSTVARPVLHSITYEFPRD
jgi:hypothetical protein